MELRNYWAKTKPKETIGEHSDLLEKYFAEMPPIYKNHFTKEQCEAIIYAARYHDYGKANSKFQKRLNMRYGHPMLQGEISHGYLSPAFLPEVEIKEKIGKFWYRAVVNTIFHHHTRRFADEADIRHEIETDIKEQCPNVKTRMMPYQSVIYPASGEAYDIEPTLEWEQYALVKGMLNRLDYAASAHSGKIEFPLEYNGITLAQTTEKFLNDGKKPRPVQEYMKEHSGENLVVVASTGIGKTEAALLWGGNHKLFYTLPLKVSINAIYDRVHQPHEENGLGFKPCGLLHSGAFSYLLANKDEETKKSAADEDFESPYVKKMQACAFAYPATICTVDQLFTFVYKYYGCEIMPAVLSYSHVVIDEIQSYSPKILAKLIFGLKIITDMGGKFAIITATMPPIALHFLQEQKIGFEAPKPFYSPIEKRHVVEYRKGDFDYERIIEQGKHKKVLVLCNTVDAARNAYIYISERSESCNVNLLHSHYITRHRNMLEAEILKFAGSNASGKGDECGIWVSTQIVEASLDLDFDELHTQMCPADRLLQRMGRCYRNRSYNSTQPNVFIADSSDDPADRTRKIYGDKIVFERSVELLQKYIKSVFTEQQKQEYINEVYDVEALRRSAYFDDVTKELLRLSKLTAGVISQKEGEQDFRNIISSNIMPDYIYSNIDAIPELAQAMETLRNENLSAEEKEIAQTTVFNYTVSVNKQYLKIKPDKVPLNLPIEIYRTQEKYDFNETTLKGIGMENILEEDQFQ